MTHSSRPTNISVIGWLIVITGALALYHQDKLDLFFENAHPRESCCKSS